jgi:PAS domain S-box-containing protein
MTRGYADGAGAGASVDHDGDPEADLRAELEEARRSERDFRRLLDDSSDPIFAFDLEGRYRYVNQAFASGVGKERDFIVGRTIWDVFEKAEADHRWKTLKRALDTGEVQVFEVRVPRPDGDRYYLTTVQPVRDPEGRVVSAMCSSKDITERKRMEWELHARLVDLEEAMAHVQRLQGILPICSHCHRIRSDPETWQKIESYLAEHSEMRFSHGLCPECFEKYYGDLK